MILLTGGTGYIGSHTATALIAAGHDVVLFDNLCNSKRDVVDRLATITGHAVPFVQGDVRSAPDLKSVFDRYPIDVVIHFAGLKAVGESVAQPVAYYDNNVGGTLALLAAMQDAGVKRFVFSSSATVYGAPEAVPVTETARTHVTNPYGRSKLMIEEMLRDLHIARSDWSIALLRYFNPVGAHSSGLIGEDPNGIPNNLMPYIAQVAVGKLAELNVYGNDYPTPDGTGVRDYIHVMDLAEGHVAALAWALRDPKEVLTVNLGTGRGYSVLEMVAAFEMASGCKVPYRIAPRRSGDIAAVWADPGLAMEKLNWRAKRGLEEMCCDGWRWQARNP